MIFERHSPMQEVTKDEYPEEIMEVLASTEGFDVETLQRFIKEKPLNGVQMLLMYFYPKWEEEHAAHFREKFLPYHPHILERIAAGDLG